MRILIARAATTALFLGGCHSGRASAPLPQSSGPQSRIVAEPLSREEIARQQRAGTVVDTIQLKTTTISLRAGESYNLMSLAPAARDAAGGVVTPFGPVFIRSASMIYSVAQGIELRALKVGVDSLYIEALPRSPSRPPHRPSTRVLIVVRP